MRNTNLMGSDNPIQKTIYSFFDNNREVLIISFLTGLIAYGYELFNFSLSIDEDISSFISASESVVYLTVGRWGVFLLNHIINPHSVLPYYPTFLTIISLALSATIVAGSIPLSRGSKIIFAMLYISHPIHANYIAFNTSGMYYAMGMVFTAISFVLFEKHIWKKKIKVVYFLAPLFFFVLALSVYQALISFLLVLMFLSLLLHLLQGNVNGRQILRVVLYYLLLFVLAVAVYKIFDLFSRYIWLHGDEKYQSEYLDIFVGWGRQSIFATLSLLSSIVKAYFTGDEGTTGISGFSTIMSPLLAILFIISIYRNAKNIPWFAIQFIVMVLMMLSPFVVMFFLGHQLPPRALFPVALMVGIVWMLTHHYAKPWLKTFILAGVFLLVLNNTYIITRLFYSQQLVMQADRDMANRIAERIFLLDIEPESNGKIPVCFAGGSDYDSNLLYFKSGLFGLSYFKNMYNNPVRIQVLYRYIGVNDFAIKNCNNHPEISNAILQMPAWPMKGSVKQVEGIVVVKLSAPF